MSNLKWLRLMTMLACLFNGLLAGGNVYRYIIEVPAWKHLNINAWGQYSAHADLGNGLWLFPAEAIGGLSFLLISSVLVVRKKSEYRIAAPLVHTATLFAILGIIFTFFAAPIMLSLRVNQNNASQLQTIFNRFHFWGSWRGIAQTLAFFANAGALAKVNSIIVSKG